MATKKAKAKKRGRPTKATDKALRARIVRAVRQGHHRDVAAAAGGVSASTLHDWIARGKADREAGQVSEFAEFSEAIETADAAYHREAFGRLLRQGKDPSTAGAEWTLRVLKLKFPRLYSEKAQIEHTGSVSTTPTVWDPSQYTDEELAQLVEIQRRALARKESKT